MKCPALCSATLGLAPSDHKKNQSQDDFFQVPCSTSHWGSKPPMHHNVLGGQMRRVGHLVSFIELKVKCFIELKVKCESLAQPGQVTYLAEINLGALWVKVSLALWGSKMLQICSICTNFCGPFLAANRKPQTARVGRGTIQKLA